MWRPILATAAMVLVCAAWAFAAEEPPAKTDKLDRDAKAKKILEETVVSFTFNEQPAEEAVDFLRTLGKLDVILDRSKFDAGKTITLKCDNRKLGDAIDSLAEQLKLKTAIVDGAVMISDEPTLKRLVAFRWAFAAEKPTAPDLGALKKLDEVIISFTFNEQPVMEAVDFLQTLGKLNIVVDRSKIQEGKTCSIKLDNASLGLAVRLIIEQLGLKSVIAGGVVFVSDDEGVKGLAKSLKGGTHFAAAKPTDADLKAAQMLDETVVTFTFNEQPALEAIDFLQTLGKVGAAGTKGGLIDEKATVTLKLENAPLATAWTFVAAQLGVKWVIEDGKVVLREAKK